MLTNIPLDRMFLVRVTAKSGTGAAATYQFEERWLTAAGTFAAKTAGRFGGPNNPGRSAGAELSVGDLALCRAADGAGNQAWELFPFPGGSSGGGPAGGCEGCEWAAGLVAADCLRATVVEGRGVCACPDSVLDAPARLFSSDGVTWVTPEITTPEQPEQHLTICGADYGLSFTRDACYGPCLTLVSRDGSSTAYTTVRGCCGCDYAVFGARLPTCDAAADPCGPCENVVRIRVEWTPCDPLIEEDGWYCVKPVGARDDQCAPVELLFAEDACRTDIEVCSGPYATREDAEAVCAEFVVGGLSCAAALAIPMNEWRRGHLDPFPQPTQHFCVPVTPGQTYKMHASATSLPFSEGLRVSVFWAANECGTLVDGVPATSFATSNPPTAPSCHNIGTAPIGATRMCVAVRHEYVFSGTYFNIRVSTGSC